MQEARQPSDRRIAVIGSLLESGLTVAKVKPDSRRGARNLYRGSRPNDRKAAANRLEFS